jgi:hypothetical protein
MSPHGTAIPARQVAEILVAVALILWRIVDRTADGLWMDWTLVLCMYWITSIFAGAREQGAAAVVFVAGLMALYLWYQLPQALVPLGLRP